MKKKGQRKRPRLPIAVSPIAVSRANRAYADCQVILTAIERRVNRISRIAGLLRRRLPRQGDILAHMENAVLRAALQRRAER